MQAIEINTAAVSALIDDVQAKQAEQATDNLVELGTLELAMVGGGSGAVSFY